jgi:hypothetical protein
MITDTVQKSGALAFYYFVEHALEELIRVWFDTDSIIRKFADGKKKQNCVKS